MNEFARMTVDHTLPRIILAEFDEMPAMRLTMAQVCRLWGLTRPAAEAIIGRLVARGRLAIDRLGRVCRPDDLEP
ncbi:MAG TPA: hypothetical protein VIL35_15925 [Vicinamibacterales bacterium]